MSWFNNLSIFKKVGVIFVLSVAIFMVNLGISIVSISKNRATLDFMEDKIYQRVELANQNVMLVQRLEEIYTQAVSLPMRTCWSRLLRCMKTSLPILNCCKKAIRQKLNS